jgi:hypothetical protein
MPDRKPKPDRPTPRKEKICKTCGRPFAFQKKWAQDWDIVKHCSDACRNQKATASYAALEQAILSLLAERASDGDRSKTICPSEAAKLVAADAGGLSGSARDKEKSHRTRPHRRPATRHQGQNRHHPTQSDHRPFHRKRSHSLETTIKPASQLQQTKPLIIFYFKKPQQSRLSSPETVQITQTKIVTIGGLDIPNSLE